MSFALAHQSKTNKSRDGKMSIPAKPSLSEYHHINNLKGNSLDPIFHLQQAIGNQAVQRLMSSNDTAKGFDFAKIINQPKLKVSQPNDAYEQEADKLAENLMSMTNDNPIASTLSHKEEKIDRKCATCEMKEKEKKEEKLKISRKPSNTPILEESDEISNEISNIRSDSGIPLDRSTREFMESRFGYDFSNVRIHTYEKAAKSAQSVNALAYTIGNDIVFGGQYLSECESGRKLLAHELTHVVQQRVGDLHIARTPEDEADAGLPDAKPIPSTTTPAPESTTTPVPEKTVTTAPAQVPTVTPGGHTVAPPGVALCPDAPPQTIVVVGCNTTPSATPPSKETAVLPTPSLGRFGSDADLATFGKDLAQCRAARTAKDEIDKRYRADVATAKKKATEESKAAADTKKAAKKRIADAEAAVTRQDVGTVTAELATKFEDALANDFDKIIAAGIARYGASWLKMMQARLDSERKRITKEKSAKPKVPKGETPPPPKVADEIAAAVEAEMVPIRCDQTEWALNRLEWLKHGWAVKSREKVDFDTLGGSAKYMKDFMPTYEVPEAE